MLHPLDGEGVGAGTADLGADAVEEVGQIHHLRLAGRVLDDGGALGEGGGDHQVFRAGNGDQLQIQHRALEPPTGGLRLDVAVLHLDVGTHRAQTVDVDIHRARTDGAATGQGDLGLAVTCQQRPEHQDRGAHGPHQLVRRVKLTDGGGVHLDVEFLIDHQLHPHVAQQLHGGGDVVQVRYVADGHRFFAQ